jgi:Tol biopolymer transport system component
MAADRWEQVSELYHAALARDTSERSQFLREACKGDETLRREVESLLTQEPSREGFLATPVVDVAARALATDGGAVPGLTGGGSGEDLIGRQIGGYHILSALGAGGMGEVYRARDLKLGREVAIKRLPPVFGADAERLRRFESEARLLAALNHPHIGTIHGLVDAEGLHGLVLELIEGPTLAERLREGPLPIAESLAVACQIAEALEAAHQKGVVHRDLKPANIKITADGTVKVLDFGLATVSVSDLPGREGSQVPTAVAGGTREGAILGTAPYMSPEQARGTPIDKRTDIWAFGCVLYEMLTGRLPFAGETISDTLARILEREPQWEALPNSTPPSVRVLLRRCLEKDPKRRLHDIADARIELEEIHDRAHHPRHGVAAPEQDAGLRIPAIPIGGSRSRHVGRRALVFGAVTATVLIAALFYLARPVVPVTSPSEYVQLTNFTDSATSPSLSPDGRMVTFKRGEDAFLSSGNIYVKLLPNGESVPLTTTAGVVLGPVFTPDGSRIAYTQRTAGSWDTWTVPVLGGQPTRLLPNASGLTWIAENRVLFSEIKTGRHMGIVTATEGRADSREIYFPPDEHAMAHYSYASPDRQWVLVVEMSGAHAFTQPCLLVPFDGSSPGRQVGPQGTCLSAAWSPDGQWMYFSAVVGGSSHLWRQRFPDGAPEQITFGPGEEEGITLAPDGRSLVTSIGMRRSAIWIHDAAGERAILSEGYASAPRLSRDGRRVFYLAVRDWWLSSNGWVASSAELRSLDLASGKSESVLSGVPVTDYDMSRDEKEVAFTTTDSSGASQIWLAPLDRRTPPREIARGGDRVSFGLDQELVFRSLVENNALVRIRKDGTGRERITTAPVVDKLGVSPDGEWVIAYLAGLGTIAVPIHGGAPRRICALRCYPTWSSDGRFLYVAHPGGGETLVIPVPAGQLLPDLPAAGLDAAAGVAGLPGAKMIEHVSISPGRDPSTYVFTKTDLQRNLFHIPLH